MTAMPAAPARGRLTEGPVRGHLVSMSLPMIGGLFAIISFNVVDTLFVAQLGTVPLAAMTFTFPVVLVFFSISIGLSAGASSVVARAIGEGGKADVRRHVMNSLYLSVLIVAICCAVGLATIDPLFTAMGATPETLPLIRDYMQIWYLGFIFLVAPMVGNGCIRATGNAKLPAIIMFATSLINLALDPILIFGLFGAPRLELEGAALATVIARALGFVAGLYVLKYQEDLLAWHIGTLAEIRDSWRRVLSIGLPAAATNLITPTAMGVVTALVAVHGASAVAGFGIATRIEGLAMVVMYAMSSVVGPIAGQNWGAGLLDRVRDLVRAFSLYSLLYGLLIAALLAALARPISALFNPDPAVTEVAVTYLLIVPLSLAGYGLLQNVAAMFNGIGKPLYGFILTALRMGALYLPLAWFLGGRIGVEGIFIAAAAANLLTGLACLLVIAIRTRLWIFARR